MKIITLLLCVFFIQIINAQKDSHIKKYEKLKEKHKGWDLCALIFTGDTLFVRIKYKDEYSTTGGFHTRIITVAYDDETEKKFYPEDFTAFIVYGQGLQENTKYLSIAEAGGNTNDLYKVIIEGKCQLLFGVSMEINGASTTGPNGTWTGKSANDEYYVYYKRALTKMKTENGGIISGSFGFKNNCREIFADCPSIVEKVNQKEYTNKDIVTIIKEFNQCLDSKIQTQQNK